MSDLSDLKTENDALKEEVYRLMELLGFTKIEYVMTRERSVCACHRMKKRATASALENHAGPSGTSKSSSEAVPW